MEVNLTNLNSVKRSTGALWMKLNTPYFFPRLRSRLDALNGGIIAIDEERFPAAGERVL